METNDNDTGSTFDTSEIALPRSVRFWLLLVFDVPSTSCAFILLFYLLSDSTARKALNNHTIILLILLGLTAQLIDIPSYLAFIANQGVVKPSVPATCLAWWFVDIGMYNGSTILMAWTAFERNILIFHHRLVSTRRGRLLVHYFPICLLLLYIFVYYIYVLFFFPCENAYDYSLPICSAYPCYQNDPFFGVWDFIMNNIVPTLLVALFSMSLLFRVIRQKRRLNQQIHWRKQRRMTIQLVSLSALNIVFNIPLNIVSLAHLCGLPAEDGAAVELYFYFLCYFLIFLFPFVCLLSYPKLYNAIPQLRIFSRSHKVRPDAVVMVSVCATQGNNE